MPILYNSINTYYVTDIKEDKLYFLVYVDNGKEFLLACSSPMTGFVTPPDMDKSIVKKCGFQDIEFVGEQYRSLHIRRKSGGEYFRDPKLLEDRDADFNNYMYNVLFSSDKVDDRLIEIKEYVRSFANDPDIRNNYQMKLQPILTEQNENLIVNGLRFSYSNEVDVNSYFTQSIIRVPYRISRENFHAVNYLNDIQGRKYDYLMPFRPEVVKLFEGKEIKSNVHINRDSVTVCLNYNGKEYKKEYAQDPLDNRMGRIVDLNAAKINFDLGVFPNILSNKSEENNYFKIMVIAADEDQEAKNININNISLSFYVNGEQIKELDPYSTGAKFGVKPPIVRSRQKTDEIDGGTKFYELFNTSFDLVEVKIHNDTGLLIPIWKESKSMNNTFTFAVDLGTSNTFVSRCKNGENNIPEQLKIEQPMVSYLHETIKDNQVSLSRCIEDSIFEKAKKRIKTEFLPAVIDGTDYKFPIRTAICGNTRNSEIPKLFDSHNIAFFYEKIMADNDQNIKTDIKWESNYDLLRVFIRELLLIIKCDILQHNGELNRTRLVWFRPLSFMGTVKSRYEEIWSEESANILCIQQKQIDCFSESEAPYYYFKKKDYIADTDGVTVIDIGGGSTDFVYFEKNRPIMANSVHFGCDILWSNGFAEFDNERQNGIYNRYKDSLTFRRKDLEDFNENFKNIKDAKTSDIINFWLGNAEFCDIKLNLSSDFKPVFAYHLTSILYYMASMYKDYYCDVPKTVIFSGNGSRYIDDFICSENGILEHIIDLIFDKVFGNKNNVKVVMPPERKESTCYGGLYRNSDAEEVPEKVYQGDETGLYKTVGDISDNYEKLKNSLVKKYNEMNSLYGDVLDYLKQKRIMDNTADTLKYIKAASEDMGTPLTNYYRSQIEEKYQRDAVINGSVFFLPVIDRVFKLTKL